MDARDKPEHDGLGGEAVRLSAVQASMLIVSFAFSSSSQAQGIWQKLVDEQALEARRATEQKVDRLRPPSDCGQALYPCKKQLIEKGWVAIFRGQDRFVIDAEHEITILVDNGFYKFCYTSLYPDDRHQTPCGDIHPVSQ